VKSPSKRPSVSQNGSRKSPALFARRSRHRGIRLGNTDDLLEDAAEVLAAVAGEGPLDVFPDEKPRSPKRSSCCACISHLLEKANLFEEEARLVPGEPLAVPSHGEVLAGAPAGENVHRRHRPPAEVAEVAEVFHLSPFGASAER
jgi:hypothetical protein